MKVLVQVSRAGPRLESWKRGNHQKAPSPHHREGWMG